jgi:Flp pilus assembly protein TadB
MTGRVDAPVLATVWVGLAVVIAALALRPQRRRVASAVGGTPAQPVPTLDTWRLRRVRGRIPDSRAVAAWCDDIARRIRSGSTLRDAVATLPADPATERATAPMRLALDRGASVTDAIARVDAGGPHLQLALGVIATASRIGGPAAASIDRAAMLLRQRASDLDERATQAAQARLSSHVMTAVPLLMLAVLVATDDDVRSVVTSPIGTVSVVAGLALNAAGWWWMRRIVGVPR